MQANSLLGTRHSLCVCAVCASLLIIVLLLDCQLIGQVAWVYTQAKKKRKRWHLFTLSYVHTTTYILKIIICFEHDDIDVWRGWHIVFGARSAQHSRAEQTASADRVANLDALVREEAPLQ